MCVLKQQKVLIVDDEPDVCILFDRILRDRNMKAEYARNLAEAGIALLGDPPEMIFLDNCLPDGQGIDYIPFLKEKYPATRVIVVTANDSPWDKRNAFQQGADDFLGKPLSLAQINHKLDILTTLGLSETFPGL